MRRGLILALALAVLMTPAAGALAADLSDYLDRGAAAEYRAEQVISCSTPDGVRDAVVEVTQSNGVVMVKAPVGGASLQAGSGSATVSAGGVGAAVTVGGASGPALDRYSTGSELGVEYLGRSATNVPVYRGGDLRATMIFDDATGAVLRSSILTGDGSVYCDTRVISFEPGTGDVAVDQAVEVRTLETAERFDRDILPDSIAGFDRLDVYQWSDDGVLAYYSDGFFSFTLLHTRRPVELSGEAAASEVEDDNGSYQRVSAPGKVMYLWESRFGGLAMFGDLPPDLQDQVLSDLPRPGKPGFFVRWWRRLFG